MPVRLGAALLAEFVGTFALCFAGIMAIYSGTGIVGIALAHGLILSVMICATMPTSGGHFNPAVTLGFLLTKKIKPVEAIGYIVIQLLAGLIASLAVYAILGGGQPGALAVYHGTPNLGEHVSISQALLAEIIATFFLVFVIWGSAADPRARNVGGFAIGLTVAADILAVGGITGASMNPARSFGPTIIGSLADRAVGNLPNLWTNHWIYWVGPLVGGCLAALIYHLILWPREAK